MQEFAETNTCSLIFCFSLSSYAQFKIYFILKKLENFFYSVSPSFPSSEGEFSTFFTVIPSLEQSEPSVPDKSKSYVLSISGHHTIEFIIFSLRD